MKRVSLEPLHKETSLQTNTELLQALLAEQCQVQMACGGNGLCATCHVHVRKGHEALSPVTDREKRTLAMVSAADADSRLSCQARVIDEGVEVEIPKAMYPSSFREIEAMIGQVAEQTILHPSDGRLLIAKGKIITRSKIEQLEGVDFSVRQSDEGG